MVPQVLGGVQIEDEVVVQGAMTDSLSCAKFVMNERWRRLEEHRSACHTDLPQPAIQTSLSLPYRPPSASRRMDAAVAARCSVASWAARTSQRCLDVASWAVCCCAVLCSGLSAAMLSAAVLGLDCLLLCCLLLCWAACCMQLY